MSLTTTVLIENYFVPELRPKLWAIGGITKEAFQYSLDLFNRSRERFRLNSERIKESGEEYQPEVRSVAFRRLVVRAYNYTCAMCRIRVITPEGRAAVVAAHIVPWSESHNDDPRNGIALCGLHHWLFDEGLVSVTDKHLIKVSKVVPSDATGTESLLSMGGQTLFLPEPQALWPATEALAWHRDNVFRRERMQSLF
jgi:putative restriction endonuclease